MQHQVILCLGSNQDAEDHIQKAQRLLREQFPDFQFSEAIWSEPVGIDSPQFLNGIAWGETEMEYVQLRQLTKAMERSVGDRKYLRAKGIIKLDIDILMYDGKKLHPEDWEREYVKKMCSTIEELRS